MNPTSSKAFNKSILEFPWLSSPGQTLWQLIGSILPIRKIDRMTSVLRWFTRFTARSSTQIKAIRRSQTLRYGRFLRLSSWRQRVLLYWIGNHHAFLLESAGWRIVHPGISINYRTLGFEWFNWGQVTQLRSLSGDYWALVEPSDDVVQDWSPLLGSPDAFDSSTCYVSVSYNVQIELISRRGW